MHHESQCLQDARQGELVSFHSVSSTVSLIRDCLKTKHFQTLFWTSDVRLVDCPGLVMPNLFPMETQVNFIDQAEDEQRSLYSCDALAPFRSSPVSCRSLACRLYLFAYITQPNYCRWNKSSTSSTRPKPLGHKKTNVHGAGQERSDRPESRTCTGPPWTS